MSTTCDWATRPCPTALSPEKLAALVDRSISRTDGMLFTATPAQELDSIGRWQRLKDLAFAGLMRDIVASYNRAGAAEREFAADEVGLAIGATTTTGGNLVAQALGLAALPGLLEAVEAGQLTERHVLAVLRELDKVDLALEQRQAVVLVMLARYRGQAPGELASVVARLVLTIDRAAAVARDVTAARNRRVWFSRDVDGQALVIGRGPAAQIAAIRAALEATLTEHAQPGDDRTREAREFDLFVDLLSGGQQAGSWHAEVVVPFSAAAGGDLELAEIPGLGPILPGTARDLLEHCDTVGQTAVDESGVVVGVGDSVCRRPPAAPSPEADTTPEVAPGPDSTPDAVPRPRRPVRFDFSGRLVAPPPLLPALTGSGYRFPPRLRRYLEARDRTCVYPSCGKPARRTDKDHRMAWPVGATSADNGQCLCRHHHRAKQTVFTVTRQPDGTYLWTTRGGWQFRRHPKGF